MRYTLKVTIRTSYSHDDDKTAGYQEYFDADNVDIAVVISKAMVQSRKLEREKIGRVVFLEAFLCLEGREPLWKIRLVPEKTELRTVVISEEHLEEEHL